MRMCHFWVKSGPFAVNKNFLEAQNGLFPQMRIFSENLLMSLVSFIHPYPHAKNESHTLIY